MTENSQTIVRAGASETPPPAPGSPFVQEEVENQVRQGRIQLRRKRLDLAREACQQALSLDPDSQAAHELMGLILEEDGDEVAALREYQRACAVEPRPAEAETRLAHLLLRLPADIQTSVQKRPRPLQPELPPEAKARLEQALPQVNATIASTVPFRPRRKSSIPAFASLIVPGLGQMINGQPGKAVAMFVTWAICVAFLFLFLPAHWANGLNTHWDDPFVWGGVFVLVVDYVISIMDAAASGKDDF